MKTKIQIDAYHSKYALKTWNGLGGSFMNYHKLPKECSLSEIIRQAIKSNPYNPSVEVVGTCSDNWGFWPEKGDPLMKEAFLIRKMINHYHLPEEEYLP